MGNNNTSSINVTRNLIWRLAERIGGKGVEFIVSIILARILVPSVYGKIALITVFITILQVFVDSGLGNALIQKKDADNTDFSSVFFFNIVFCCFLYLVLFSFAPLIAHFFNDTELVPVIRVLGLIIVISGVKNVQQAYVSKNMLFKKFFFSTLGGTIGSAIIGITMAYMGFGIWALVAQQIFNVAIDTLILWITVKWRPQKTFCFDKLKSLYSFGWRLLVSNLIDAIYNDIRQLIIGKMYTSSDLAYFNRAKQFPQFITANVNTSINSVLFPTMSSVQDDKVRVKAITRRAIKTSTYIMTPLLVGLAVCGKSIVKLILTDKWLPVVPYLIIFCITDIFLPIHTANLNAIKAIGRSDLYLKLEIIKKIVGIVALLSSMWFGVMAMAYSLLISNILSQIINSWPNKKLLNYSYFEQLYDMLPQIGLSLGMGIVVYFIQYIGLNDIFTLLIQLIVGMAIYWLGSKVFHIDSYEYVLNLIKRMVSRK